MCEFLKSPQMRSQEPEDARESFCERQENVHKCVRTFATCICECQETFIDLHEEYLVNEVRMFFFAKVVLYL
jgi:hypothetical protein